MFSVYLLLSVLVNLANSDYPIMLFHYYGDPVEDLKNWTYLFVIYKDYRLHVYFVNCINVFKSY